MSMPLALLFIKSALSGTIWGLWLIAEKRYFLTHRLFPLFTALSAGLRLLVLAFALYNLLHSPGIHSIFIVATLVSFLWATVLCSERLFS